MMEGSALVTNGPERLREVQKHMDPTDPDPDADPQHCSSGQ
jgi:hypothetical protein